MDDSMARARRLAEAVRSACHAAALAAYEDARADGLCCDGALEAALSALAAVDVASLAARLEAATRGRVAGDQVG